jgi:hypothetical protein
MPLTVVLYARRASRRLVLESWPPDIVLSVPCSARTVPMQGVTFSLSPCVPENATESCILLVLCYSVDDTLQEVSIPMRCYRIGIATCKMECVFMDTGNRYCILHVVQAKIINCFVNLQASL